MCCTHAVQSTVLVHVQDGRAAGGLECARRPLARRVRARAFERRDRWHVRAGCGRADAVADARRAARVPVAQVAGARARGARRAPLGHPARARRPARVARAGVPGTVGLLCTHQITHSAATEELTQVLYCNQIFSSFDNLYMYSTVHHSCHKHRLVRL